jgi:hypothetical protein
MHTSLELMNFIMSLLHSSNESRNDGVLGATLRWGLRRFAGNDRLFAAG